MARCGKIRESPDGGHTVYEREFGSTERTLLPQKHDTRTWDGRPLRDHMQEDKLWGDIRRMARTNETLKSELERVIMLYKLLKADND